MEAGIVLINVHRRFGASKQVFFFGRSRMSMEMQYNIVGNVCKRYILIHNSTSTIRTHLHFLQPLFYKTGRFSRCMYPGIRKVDLVDTYKGERKNEHEI